MTTPYGNIFGPKSSTEAPETGFHLAPIKTEGRMYSYDLQRELTPEEEVVARREQREAATAKAAFDRSLRGHIANFFTAVNRAYVAFKDEDSGL